ncbi:MULTISPECIES: DUF305 domain-containing protein [Micromonospora]|uniref:Uncharacterized conserved protein, DUF305 family n=1 Tax=Micromonospora yangpuensis TaxID=683228 RepID=A0A1C6U5X5_9ACTN|nr:DUF305 domain-containing protein [Micromonospora yangpuensis]GGL91621.1 lipoprotein [Micromonospora yangpuensis]SCL49328.1 Uncharacterized conserved protein, DUF305 family [Micromonospora yangpuensis]
MLGERIRGRSRRWRGIALVELAVVGVLVAGVAVAVGLAGDDDPEPTASAAASPDPIDLPGLPDSTAPVLVPGRPGETARQVPSNEYTPRPAATYNAADVRFVTMMIPHHEQALVMARLAPERAGNQQIALIADRILAAQGPEIKALESWLAAKGLTRDTAGDQHGHDMAGMQSAEALKALENARGADFDKRFVDMMTNHHQGAITMAEQAQTLGVDPIVNESATSVALEQAVEIQRMKEALAG